MTATPEPEQAATDLAGYVNASGKDLVFVGVCLAQATTLVARHTTGATIPDDIMALAVREVAADIFHRRRVRNGVATFEGSDLAPMRVTRDPFKAAADILAPWLGPGVA